MKQNLLAILLALSYFCMADAYAQAPGEPIDIIEKGIFKKKVYRKCDIELMPTQMITLFKNDPNMSEFVKPMALTYGTSKLLSAVGWALIFWPIAESVIQDEGDGDPNWNLAYAGAGCVVLSIPLTIAYNRKAMQAVSYYNAGYKRAKLDVGLGVSRNGVGLMMKF
jgi:hypothetical protein